MRLKNVNVIKKIVKEIFTNLNCYQSKNLAGIIYAIIIAHSPIVAEIARSFPYQKAYHHARKRIERFLRNTKWCLSLCQIKYIKKIIRLIPKTKRQSVIIDYTFLGSFMILWAGIPFKSRCIPIHFRIIRNPHITKRKQRDRMINLEIDFLIFLRINLPWDRKWVIIGDRGFGNTRNIQTCQSFGFGYIFRVKGDFRVIIRGNKKNRYRRIENLPLCRWRQKVQFYEITTNLLTLTDGTDDPWYLFTSSKNPKTTKRLYEQRMWIEEMFRDMKTHEELKRRVKTHLNSMKKLCFAIQITFVVVLLIGVTAKESKIVKKKIFGYTKVSFVFVALQLLKHFSQKFFSFLKKTLRNLRLPRALLDTS